MGAKIFSAGYLQNIYLIVTFLVYLKTNKGQYTIPGFSPWVLKKARGFTFWNIYKSPTPT